MKLQSFCVPALGSCAGGLLLGLALAAPAQAEGFQLYTNIGTLGLGGGVGTRFTQSLGGRLGFSTFTYNKDGTYASNQYAGQLKLRSYEALADLWLSGTFRVTAGAVYNQNRVALVGKLTSVTITLNGTQYPANSARAEVDLGRGELAPYLGFGFGSRPTNDGGFGFRVDFGAVRQRPLSTITINSPAVDALRSSFPNQYAIYQANLAAEEQKLRDSVSRFRYWPVLNLGVVYSF